MKHSEEPTFGIRPQFPGVKKYLRKFVMGAGEPEQDTLFRLERYVSTGSFLFRYAPALSENTYTNFSASSDLSTIAASRKWNAIQMALNGEAAWHEKWREAISFEYWGLRLNSNFHKQALKQFERGERSQKLQMMFLHLMGANLGNCLSLGWTDWTIDIAQQMHWGLDNDVFNDGGDAAHRRTHHFLLRMVGSWQGWAEREAPVCAYDEPLFSAVLEHWRTPDAAAIAPLLVSLCDRHTHQARPDTAKEFFDMPYSAMEYDPFEVRAVMRLRELHDLPNPVLDHVVMNTALGELPQSTQPYLDDLVRGVVNRAGVEITGA